MKQMLTFFVFILIVLSCDQKNSDNNTPFDTSFSSKILYSKNVNGHNEVYLLDNSIETLVLSDPNYDYWWPKVHPNKTKFLVYRSPVNPEKNHDAYDQAALVLVNIDGSNPEVLIELSTYNWKSQGVCRWNQDGSKILMCAEIEVDNSFQWRLISTNSLGQNPKVLSNYWAIDCNISSDDSEIIFMGFSNNNLSTNLTKLELLKGVYDAVNDTIINIASLTENTTRDHDPDYSPDNKFIVFSGGNVAYSNVDLILYDVQKNEERIILDDNSANGGSMCWTQDGSYVVFHSLDVFVSPFKIKTIHIETGEVRTLLEAPNNDYGYVHPETY